MALEFFKPLLQSASNKTIIIVAGVCFFLILFLLIFKKIRERKMYDILVEVVPRWSLKKIPVTSEPEEIVKKNLFGKTIKIKKEPEQREEQKFMSYFTEGAYIFDKNTGTYTLKLRDEKTPIGEIPYHFFIPIDHKKYTRYLKLLRYGPMDYKPCKVEIDEKSLKEIRNVYDSEATYVVLKTQEEIQNRFKKISWLQNMLPFIMVAVCLIIFIIAVYLLQKGQKEIAKSISEFSQAIGEYTKAILMSAK